MHQPWGSFILPTLNYDRLKLFLLSLLWRLGIANVTEFRPAKLGPHSEKLRGMLLQDKSGGWLEYPCMVTGIKMNGSYCGGFSAGAFWTKVHGCFVWSFVISGLLFDFFVSNQKPPTVLHPLFLQHGGKFEIGLRELKDVPFLYEFAIELAVAQKQRKAANT